MTTDTPIGYALYRDGKRVSKAHTSKIAAFVEAYEAGGVIDVGADFFGDKPARYLADGYEIKEVPL